VTITVSEVARTPYPGRTPAAPVPDPALAAALTSAEPALAGRRIWHVNSTATGGGVAELLHSFLRRHNDVGVPTGWLVADAPADFFAITKQLYHLLYGTAGDGATLGEPAERHYRDVTDTHAAQALGFVSPGDLAVLHDPQTLGMAPRLTRSGVRVIWQCHLGSTLPNPLVGEAWRFLGPYLPAVERFVFSHPAYVPDEAPPDRVHVIAPAIDPVSAKNRPLAPGTVAAVLGLIGLTPGAREADIADVDAATGRSSREMAGLARITADGPVPDGAQVLLQVSRWDRLKDMGGVLTGFAGAAGRDPECHLVLAGPDPGGIADDPGGREVYAEVLAQRATLPLGLRGRVHLVATSTDDLEGTAFIINALQQRAQVISQKSLREGFGLTVAEGRWKGRPVIAGDAGGMPLQIADGETGLLVDPADPDAFALAAGRLLDDPALRRRIGAAGRADCAARFLIDRQLREYLDAFAPAVAGARATVR
jgi:trehalose synthase